MGAVHDRDLCQDRSQRRADTAGLRRDASEVVRLTSEASYLVRMVARRFAARGVALEDLVAAGNVGLVMAAHRFDARKGVQFSTYAVWWVQREIMEAIGKERLLIRIPRYASELRRRVLEDGAAGFSARQIRRAEQTFVPVLSLDASRDDDGRTLEDRIADPGALLPMESVEFEDAKSSMGRALAALRPRERAVVELRYGIGVAEPLTLNEVAARLGLSRERIRQIQAEALTRLRKLLGAALTSRARPRASVQSPRLISRAPGSGFQVPRRRGGDQ
jgi:RNA polymerase primary sigma factor